MLLQD